MCTRANAYQVPTNRVVDGSPRLKVVDDLLLSPDERVELIGGEIMRRPMSRFEHAQVRSRASRELGPFDRKSGPEGWWIATEVSVADEAHDCSCPSHDLAGWRRERLPNPPAGVVQLALDWVGEIVSPGHEKRALC